MGISIGSADFNWNHGSSRFPCLFCSRWESKLDFRYSQCWWAFLFKCSRIAWFDHSFHLLLLASCVAMDTKLELSLQPCVLAGCSASCLYSSPKSKLDYRCCQKPVHMHHALARRPHLDVPGTSWRCFEQLSHHALGSWYPWSQWKAYHKWMPKRKLCQYVL